ncbi:MAG TPA: MotA/TolQ/ExbB proton channel family protein [Polyangiaceae bacterium]|jgi:biopolymer transport protein ExbB/TolQ|nr:MAG: colicin uptake protein TolQ [Deltaproteobacteria bacterium ADurb.Bin207]HNS99279.1 MotA/TolQ/ExbB proton channel family protein [Polyangiaceae bacterium]HNZ24429.1 MotA/TolQ/ExbB proton channel family protein [Polyangiaceae bacterium]HOD22492.1 MotA/TolQ/ExbB proton channel family protein [Polyangiaceae bacterium]HOE49200.1 MotA/TolQ/ExbB proton channel family protein [Polyangiaceae bacterium]
MRLVLMLAALQEASAGGGEIGFMEAYKKSPWFLTMNMVVSVVVISIIAERFLYQLTKYRVNSKEFFSQVKKLVTGNNIDRAIKLCEASDYPILQLVKAGLTHANKTPDEIDAALSERFSELKPAIERRIGSLWSLANIATLIGLLGTVTGLIATFAAVSAQGLSQAEKQRLLSLGIAEAMWNTAFGLGIAVACMIAHLILSQRAKKLAHELEATMEKVFNLLAITNKPTGY